VDLVVSLAIKPGDVVGDVGTGTGYFLRYLLAAAGERGSLVAEDVHPDFLEIVRQKLVQNGWKT
jgi:ubiquinone/menaquinone biosynthesis C-methylase UbiE